MTRIIESVVRYKATQLPDLTDEQVDNLHRLAARAEADIDLLDMPEVTDWSQAKRGGLIATRDTNEKGLI